MMGSRSFPPQPPPKKGNGCLIAAAVVGGIVVVLLATSGIVAWKAYHLFTPEERAQLGSEINESMEAGVGPAADDLRAIGCFGVDIVDVATMPALTKSLVDAGPKDPKPVETTIVDCRPNMATPTPISCDLVAKTYVKSMGRAKGPFRVMVHKVSGEPALCTELRGPDGARR